MIFFCTIQDKRTLGMIGLANLQQGLYHLQVNKEAKVLSTTKPSINESATNTISNSNLWHYRLGHLSGNRLNMLCEQFPFIPKHINENCDICHFAKQRKLPYCLSDSRASKKFDMVHMDIWGLFLRPPFMVKNIF